MMLGLVGVVVLGAVVIGVVAVIRRVMGGRREGPDAGGDVVAYLLLALAMGVAGFSLASLAATAFPADDLVIDVSGRLANALAGVVVATPVALFLWRRQEQRRSRHPAASGWTVYLALIEAVFTTALVVALFGLFDWLTGGRDGAGWTNIVVFGGVIAFHEWAARRTPPASDGADLPRVVGSVIGLIPVVFGLGGIVGWLLSEVYATLTPSAGGSDLGTWVSLFLAGAPVWAYKWLRPWDRPPGTPRNAWMLVVSVTGLTAAIGAVAAIVNQTLLYFFQAEEAGIHFDILPGALSTLIVGWGVWAHHRRRLGFDRGDPVRAYEYAMTGIGLVTTVGSATALSTAALGPGDLVGRDATILVPSIVALAAGATVWWLFWQRAESQPREVEASSAPRRLYLLGVGILTGLASAGALIATLVILFQRLLGAAGDTTVIAPASLAVFAALATWHLLSTNSEDRELIGSPETTSPFEVTLVCSHPGMIATRFHPSAKLRVLYRGDEAGIVDDEMAGRIVEEVGHRPSIVWVDQDGFRVAPARR